jgi:hypothetical protein
MFGTGANEITIKDIEDFLNGEGAATPAAQEGNEGSPATQPNASEGTPAQNGTEQTPVTETQAFAHRLKEATNRARNEERESIAKSLGYESYADMQQKREAQLLEEKGLNPEDVSPVVEQIVQQRLAEDPRLKELDSYRQERVNAWAKKELAELSELTQGKVSKLEDVPKDVIELWKTKGSLKGAYLELHGETLIREMLFFRSMEPRLRACASAGKIDFFANDIFTSFDCRIKKFLATRNLIIFKKSLITAHHFISFPTVML